MDDDDVRRFAMEMEEKYVNFFIRKPFEPLNIFFSILYRGIKRSARAKRTITLTLGWVTMSPIRLSTIQMVTMK